MTEQTEKSLVEEYEETDEGAQDLAAASLAAQVMELIKTALDASPLDQRALAAKLGVSEARVSQVVNGDGNLRIAAVARYLQALGYGASISAHPVDPNRPELAHRERNDPYKSAPWLQAEHADVTRHVFIWPAVSMLIDGALDKALFPGLGAHMADISWAEESTFNVGLHSPIRVFGVRKHEHDVDETWNVSAGSHHAGPRR